jgi:hypothetical protein
VVRAAVVAAADGVAADLAAVVVAVVSIDAASRAGNGVTWN